MPVHEFNDINLNDCWLGVICPVSAGTGLSQHVDELRNHWSGYRLWLPGGADRHPRSVLGRQIAENHILGGYLLQRLADHRHPIPRRDKGERARSAVRFLGDSRLETRATAGKSFLIDARRILEDCEASIRTAGRVTTPESADRSRWIP